MRNDGYRGTIKEVNFADSAKAAKQTNWDCTKTTDDVDSNNHIDYTIDGTKESVDVKEMRGEYSKGPKQDITTVSEFKSVPSEHKKNQRGSLFGDATYIAYETHTEWLIVKTEDAIAVTTRSLTAGEGKQVDNIRESEGNLYYRRYECGECEEKESDIITTIRVAALRAVATYIIPKLPL